jgi:hypothetical protein
MYIPRMKGQDYIDATRAYLDYLEEHLNNVAKAFDALSRACDGKEYWVGDDYEWHTLRGEVIVHDISKFSMEEFVQYREAFFPIKGAEKTPLDESAWEHHKQQNHHHHETAETDRDIVHMVIDWMAMSYKFGDNPRDFYNKTKPKMKLREEDYAYIERLFDHLENYTPANQNPIRKNGLCICICEPRGDSGLEGSQRGDRYRFEHIVNEEAPIHTLKNYYRVFPDKDSTRYETCSKNAFARHFEEINEPTK